MYGLPLVFAIFILLYEFPAGLLVYWITTNLWTVGQGYMHPQKLGPIMPVKLDGDDDEPGGGPKETMFSRLTSGAMGAKSAPAPATPAASRKPSGPPPPSPRKKKKRSGRRR